MANLKIFFLSIIGVLHFTRGQNNIYDKGLIKRKPAPIASPCRKYSNDYDEIVEDRKGKGILLAAAGGAAVGYYLGMKHQNQPIINNNIYNEYFPPCGNVQGGWGGSSVGGGGGILGHHPILSNIIQGAHGSLLNGNGLGSLLNRPSTISANRINSNFNWNRAIRQFKRGIRIII